MTIAPVGNAPAATAAVTSAIPLDIASRPMSRPVADLTVSVLNGGTSFPPIPIPASGFMRAIELIVTFNGTVASAGALSPGDGPFNLISNLSLSDATGTPLIQPISGYSLYLLNKYFGVGAGFDTWFTSNPMESPDYAYSATATTLTASYILRLELEQDSHGYMAIPNLDSNASPQLRIDAAQWSAAFAGTGATVASLNVKVNQLYYAPVGATTGGVPNQTTPPGYGDYMQTRFENFPVIAGSENVIPLSSKGGLIKGVVLVSRNAGVRTDYAPGTKFGYVYDNNEYHAGGTIEAWRDRLRRAYGYTGADITTSHAPVTAGVRTGLDRGVVALPFFREGPRRHSWLPTRVGTLLQVKVTPGAGAAGMDVITQLGQVRDGGAFYA